MCLYASKSKKGTVLIAIYVDDNLLVRNKAVMEKTLNLLQNEECKN